MKQRVAYALFLLGIALVLGLALVGASQALLHTNFSQSSQAAASASTSAASVSSGTDRASQAPAASSGEAGSPAHVAFELTDAIMGESIISAETMVALYHAHGAEYPSSVYEQAGAATIEDFCKLCAEEADVEGVRAGVLFAQVMHETAWLQFGNQVSAEQNNFGGLGAVNGGGAGEVFPDVRTGLRAQVQHLKAYASTEDLYGECVDPRFDLVERGSAPTVFDLGGRWAWPGDGYGDAIMAIMQDLYALEFSQVKSE